MFSKIIQRNLQSYIDKKIDREIKNIATTVNGNVARLISQHRDTGKISAATINLLHERIVHLEKYIGVEFITETGYKKIKKSK
jgi:ABC-type protease/lipase transport system fused ATPase/permease subunit